MMDTEKLKHTRVVAHIDLDAFYAQVEHNRNPRLQGASVAVIQYNPFGDLKTYTESDERIFNHSHGSIIAISYGDARKVGVKRGMRGKEARALCPSLQLVQVPTLNGKADLTMYRRHGQEVLNVLAEADHSCGYFVHLSAELHGVVCEKASIDESYLDVTDAAMARLQKQEHPWSNPSMLPEGVDQIHVGCLGGCSGGQDRVLGGREWLSRPVEQWDLEDLLLAHGAAIIAEKRAKVHDVCPGVAHTKLLAKLCSGLNKPNKQTVVPQSSVAALLHDLPLEKLRGLGGELGRNLQSTLGVDKIPLEQLQREIGEEKGMWLYRMARGHDGESVTPRTAPKSIGCGKTFRGHLLIKSTDKAQEWLGNLANEIHARLEEDNTTHLRHATRLVLHIGSSGAYKSISCALHHHTAAAISEVAGSLFRRWQATAKSGWAVSGLSLNATSFCNASARNSDVRSLLTAGSRKKPAADHPSKPPPKAPCAGGPQHATQAALQTVGEDSQVATVPHGEVSCVAPTGCQLLSENKAVQCRLSAERSSVEAMVPGNAATLKSASERCAQALSLHDTESPRAVPTAVIHHALTRPCTHQEHADTEQLLAQPPYERCCASYAQQPHDPGASSGARMELECDHQVPTGHEHVEPPLSSGVCPDGSAILQQRCAPEIAQSSVTLAREEQGTVEQQHSKPGARQSSAAHPGATCGNHLTNQVPDGCHQAIIDDNAAPAEDVGGSTVNKALEQRPSESEPGRLSFNSSHFVPNRISAVDLAALPADIRSELYLAQRRVVRAGVCDGVHASPKKKVARTSGSVKASINQEHLQRPQQSIHSFFGSSRTNSIGGQ